MAISLDKLQYDINDPDNSSNTGTYLRADESGFVNVPYDEVQVAYPTSTTETYTFKLASSTVRVLTVTYVASDKVQLQSVVRTA